MRKAYKIITNVILIIMLLLVAMLFLPRVVGLKPLAVLSGSMEPTYHVGSLIYVKSVEPSSICLLYTSYMDIRRCGSCAVNSNCSSDLCLYKEEERVN